MKISTGNGFPVALQTGNSSINDSKKNRLWHVLMILPLMFVLFISNAFAQPTAMSINQDVSGTYTNSAMTLQGGAFRARFQEDGTGTSSGTRNWQFNADAYFNQWGATSGAGVVTLASYNSVIAANTATASANWYTTGYNNNGRLPATQANFYYTYNIMKGTSYASQRMAVLETGFNPVSVNTVTQSAGTYASRTVSITTSATPNAGENIFVRYSTNSFSTSTIVQATGAGTAWTATIPWQSSAVSFYVYTSNRSKASIDADVTAFSSQEIHDLSTLNLNNNSGTNYSWTPLTGAIIVTSTGGTGAAGVAYTSFTIAGGVFTALNTGTAHTGTVTALITANVTTETGATALNNSAIWTSLGVQPNGARTISGAAAAAAALINFNGADNVTIDGLNTGGNALTISNTTVAANSGTCTIKFILDATGNTITNCSILGSSTMAVGTNGGNIFFSTGTTTGNDNNTISNNNIGPAGANLPSKGIYGNGSTTNATIGNSGIVINNNNIFDFFGAVATAGIYVGSGCNTWSITNNRLYQTATRTFTGADDHRPIDIVGSNITNGANAMTITGNIIGYASNTQTGTYTMSASTGKFAAIHFNGPTLGTSSTISNNTIAGISYTGATGNGQTTATPFAAIFIENGNVVTNSNTIGSQSATGSLTYSTTTGNSTDLYGIFNNGADNWTASSNNIGGISFTNAGTVVTNFIYGLRANIGAATTFTAASNLIGGTIANSIQLNATPGNCQVVGILTSAGAATFTSNTIRNLTNNQGAGTTTNASVIGINITSTNLVHTISQNTIYNLANTNTSIVTIVTGIQFDGSTGANVIERNNIYGLTTASNSATAEVNGIRIAGGTATYRNNMIALGAGINNAVIVNGINEPASSGIHNMWHNSIYIGGSPSAGTANSFAFNSLVTSSVRSFRDNIFMNVRSNTGTATGKNYAAQVGGTAANPAGLTLNNNVYYVSGTGTVFGRFDATDRADLAAWKAAIGSHDANSFQADPQFNDPTNATPDLHIHPTNLTVVEGSGADVGVTNDYDGQTRASLTPVDIGADAGNFVAANMVYTSSTAVQQTSTVCAGTSNVPILRMEVVTTNPLSPLTLTSLTINGAGTSNLADVATYRIYYTGTSSTFSTANPIIAAAGGLTSTDIVVTPASTVTLAEGTNYFWLVYNFAGTATGPSADGQFTAVALSTGGGTPTVTDPAGVVTVNPNSTISLTSGVGTDAQTLCINTALTTITYAIGGGGTGASITSGAFPAGVTGSFSAGGYTISGTPTASGNFSYTITTSGGGCTQATASGTISVTANATITLTTGAGTANQTKCINTALSQIKYSMGGSATSISITAGALPAGVTGVFSAGVFTISGTPTVSGVFNFTVTTAGPCVNPSLSGSITVNANSTMSLSSAAGTDAQTVCISTPITNITYAVGGGATTASLISGAFPTGVTGAYSAGVYTISGTPTVSGNFNYSIRTSGPCTEVTLSGTMSVIANATITLSSAAGTDAQNVCINTAMTNITYVIAGSGTGASITAGALPAGVTGVYNLGVFTIGGTPTVAGNYSYTVTTTGPCANPSLSGTINVTANATLTLTSAAGTDNQTLCKNTAITDITYAAGSGATSASITSGSLPAGVTGSFAAGVFTISGTPTVAGIFNYTVTTSGGSCGQASANGSITVNQTPTASAAVTNLSACGASFDGAIAITAGSGTSPYNYAWTGITGSGNPATTQYPDPGNVATITNLNIGYYNVTVSDANGCSTSLTNIHVQYAFSTYITYSGNISSSCGNTGSIIVYTNAGVAPYTYSIDGTNYFVSNSFTNLAAGPYTIYVKDAAGCISTKNVSLAAAAAIAVAPFVRNPSSCAADGSIEIYRSGGIPPYQYSLDGITYQAGNIYTALAAGPYTAYVKDSKGCVGSQAVTLVAGAGLTVTASKTNTSTCVNDGTIQVNVTGGVAPYTYSKTGIGGPFQAGNSFTGLAAGNYPIVVKDSKGCTGSLNVNIALNTITVTANATASSTCISNNGSIQLFRTGGVGPYTYSIDGNTYQAGTTFTGLAPGTYDGYVKDSKTCIGVLNGIVVGPTCGPIPVTRSNTKQDPSMVSISRVLSAEAYPNPSNTEFTLVLKNSSKEKVSIIVTDIMGRKVYEMNAAGKQQYRFGNALKAGIYNLQVMQGDQKQNIKLIKE